MKEVDICNEICFLKPLVSRFFYIYDHQGLKLKPVSKVPSGYSMLSGFIGQQIKMSS